MHGLMKPAGRMRGHDTDAPASLAQGEIGSRTSGLASRARQGREGMWGAWGARARREGHVSDLRPRRVPRAFLTL